MLNIDNEKWQKIDKSLECVEKNNIRFVRPIGYKPIDISCSFCNKLIATVDDVQTMKEAKVCENCYDMYYYHNKEKWKNGWRPNIDS
jgi:hypothetical protein